MRKLLAFFVLLIPFYSINAMVRGGVEVAADNDDDAVVEEVWIGPGYYYGYWFADEDSYHNWYRRDYHRHHHDGRHHGGGHHGGGHGGGHHGGGHGRHH